VFLEIGSGVVVPGRGRAAPRYFYFSGKEPGRRQGAALALRNKHSLAK
jgi:hypothetical protein